MIAYILLGINLLMKFIQSLFNKKTSEIISGVPVYLSYGAYRYLLSALMAVPILLIPNTGKIIISWASIASSALAAVSLVVSLYCTLEAMKSGAIVLCSLASGAGLLLPCVIGIFAFDEPMSVWQFVGIGLLIFSAYLLIGYSKKLYTKFTFKTAALLVGSMISNGLIMVAQKMYSLYVKEGSAAMFSVLMFGMAAVMFFVCMIIFAECRHEKIKLPSKPLLGYGVIMSGALLVVNQLSTILGRMIPSAVLFSVNDGGGTIISALTAAIFFHEKLTLRSCAGIILGIAAILIINIL